MGLQGLALFTFQKKVPDELSLFSTDVTGSSRPRGRRTGDCDGSRASSGRPKLQAQRLI